MAEAVLPSLIHCIASLITGEGRRLLAVGRDVNWLRDELRSMRLFLREMEACGGEDAAVTAWIDHMIDLMHDSEDVVDVFDTDKVRGGCFLGSLRSRHGISLRIRAIRAQLSDISRRRSEYAVAHGSVESSDKWVHGLLASSPLVHDGDIVGLDRDLDLLLRAILQADMEELSVVSLVGMGGAGKTTLAKKVYNHPDVKKHFDRSSWVYVSSTTELRSVLREMAKGLMRMPSVEAAALGERELQELLLRGLDDKRFLLVLDDVWDKGFWEVIRLVLPRNGRGSRVLVTTRNAHMVDTIVNVKSTVHELRPLSFEDSWALFVTKAFPEDRVCSEALKDIANDIVNKCAGLPLALVTAGSIMSRTDRREAEWRRVLANVQKDLSKDGMGVVQRALLLSYRDLPRALKPCFLLLSVIPYDMEISRKKLVRLWIAEGFVREEGGETLEATAEMYLMELISRSMIQVSIASAGGRLKACRVHNLVHDLAVSLSEKEKFSVICRDQGVNVGARRVSFQASDVSFGNEHKKRRLRSVFMFSSNEPLEFTHNDARKLRLLRVLDLEDAKVTKLPNEIGVLIHLRYLGLRGTKLKKIPSLQRLCHLQTLDIRNTRIKELAFQLKCLRNLRHLEMKHGEQSIRVTIGLARLDKLQVLTGLQATTAMVHEIASLKQLKKLALEDLSQEDVKILCSSVSNLKELSYLSIFSRDVNQPLDLSMLKPSPCLQKLHLAGSLQDLPSWFGELHNLTKLRLSFSQLREDPLTVLARLLNLLFLQLNNAYQGTFMRCCNSGFRKLKILVITELEGLERWVVAEGAMQCIQEVWIMSCTRLAMVPAGFRSLVTLHKLTLVGMPSSFVDSLGELGEDLVSVEHIPSIQILPQIG